MCARLAELLKLSKGKFTAVLLKVYFLQFSLNVHWNL